MTTEKLTGISLRAGVITSMLLTVTGGVLYLIQNIGIDGSYIASHGSGAVFTGVEAYLRGFCTLVPRVLQFDGAAIIQLGVTVLIATPVLRVVMSLVSFLREKDMLYAAITATVLAVIMANMIFGLH